MLLLQQQLNKKKWVKELCKLSLLTKSNEISLMKFVLICLRGCSGLNPLDSHRLGNCGKR